MLRVELHHWTKENGYTHSETFDHIEEEITAKEYWNSLEEPISLEDNEAINVELYDDNDNLVSEYFAEAE